MVAHIEGVHVEEAPASAPDNRSTSELLADLSEQLSRLIHAEVRLATVELRRKGKRAGLGAGLLGLAAGGAFLGAAALVACAILALALVLPAWLSALIIGVVILLGAGMFAFVARFALRAAAPPPPSWAITSVRDDVKTIAKGVAHR